MAFQHTTYECSGTNHSDYKPAVLRCGTCKANICGDCAVSKDHSNHSNTFLSIEHRETSHKDDVCTKRSAEEIGKRLEMRISELNRAKSSRQTEIATLRKTVNERLSHAEKRLKDEKDILDERLQTEENADISSVDNLVAKLVKRKQTIESLLIKLGKTNSRKTAQNIEFDLQSEMDTASHLEIQPLQFRQLAITEENKEAILGCLHFDERPHFSSDFQGFQLAKTTILSSMQIRLKKIETICSLNDSEVWIGYSKKDKIYRLKETDGCLRKKERYRLMEFKPINISALSNGDLIFSCAYENMITTMNQLYECSLYIDTYHLMPLGLYVNKKDEMFVCLLDEYSYVLTNSSIRQITKYGANQERLMVIEKDIQGMRNFTMPQSVIENINGDICVIDVIGSHNGRLVVFDKNGEKRFEYNGRAVTKSSNCDLSAITHDSIGNIIMSDESFSRLHILTKDGDIKGLVEIGKANSIFCPFAILCDSKDTLWIGCKSSEEESASQLVHMAIS